MTPSLSRLTLFLTSTFLLLMSCKSGEKKPPTLQEKIPLRDFFKNKKSYQYKLSPNGKFIAYLKTYKHRMNVFIRSVEGTFPETRITHQLDRDVRSLEWKGNNTILFIRDFGGDENFHLFAVQIRITKTKEIKSQKETDLTPFQGVKVHLVNTLYGIDPAHVLISHNQRDKRFFDLYKLNVKTSKIKILIKNTQNFSHYILDHLGQVRMATATNGVNSKIFYRENAKENFKEILSTHFYEHFKPLLFTSDNKKVYALSNLGRDKKALVEWNPKTRKERKLLFIHPEVDVGFNSSPGTDSHPNLTLGWSRKDKKLLYVIYYTWKRKYHFFDSKFKNHFAHISSQLKGKNIKFTSSNKHEDLHTLEASSDRSPGASYTYNTNTHQLTLIGKPRPWIKESEMAEMKPITYKSRDGLTIHGYLTLPLKNSKKNLSTVIHPHGGPWLRDHWEFNPIIQFLANRGFAVLQMNFRGSIGYGKKFWMASFKEWGLKMQDDVTDGVQWLIDQRIANKNKICIFGKSYGGYVTLAGLAFTPNLYKCGIDYVGISNLFTLMETIPPYWKPYRDMMHKMIGHPKKDKDTLTQTSPLFHASQIKAPLFVAHGAKDPRVKKSESDQIVEALKKRGIDVQYLVKENEGHGFHNEENRLEFFQSIEKFLLKHLK